MSLKLNSSGGGSVTLQEPATASNFTLNLPAINGTVVSSDSSGNVGIGTSSPGTILQIGNPSDANQALRFDFSDSSTARINSTRVGAGNLQSLLLAGQDTMQFQTVGTERMRIDSSGNLRLGTTSAYADERFSVFAGSQVGMVVRNTGVSDLIPVLGNQGGSSASAMYVMPMRFGDTTFRGGIYWTGSAIQYNTSSDYRLKENIAPMTGALAKVAQLKPCTYTWKESGIDSQGFIAHELAEVVPECVTGEKDAVDAEGNPIYQGIDTSFLVATLTAAIQELKAELDSAKAEIAELKAKVGN